MSVPRAEEAAGSVILEASDTALVVDVSGGVPRILHWGPSFATVPDDAAFLASLGDTQGGADLLEVRKSPSVLPEQSAGWMGTPGLEGHRNGTSFSSAFELQSWRLDDSRDGVRSLVVDAEDPAAQLLLTTTIEMLPSGLIRVAARVTNTAQESDYCVDALRVVLPIPAEAVEILDFTGRHLRERTPQRHPFVAGTHLREGRRGRTGSDASILLAAGTPGFGFRSGEVWAVHTAWSGNHATFAELGLTGARVLGAGELLLPGEMILGPGASYSSPFVYGAYGEGLDRIAQAFHDHLRGRASHPASPRPVVLNTWEAVYFDQDLPSLTQLAELAARVGVERFVLDDGWFTHRRHDRAGLGDWQVARDVWPDGLGPLVDVVRSLGMQFGLWFEPEMVNEDSDVARAHPEWILAPGERLPITGRSQQVLNLTIPEALDYILESMSSLIEEYSIDYIKWDHNRDLVEAGDRATGAPRVHAQTLATYALMDELHRRHPALEIESCSSGGGRVDLGVLERTQRVWASDCIDALERQQIQRWTGLLLPPELVGSHVGAPTAHTTHRTHSLAFRAATAVFGHFGIEWDLRDASPSELEELAAWVELYKSERHLIHTGTAVHSDYPDDAYWAHGYVSPDRDRALISFVALGTTAGVHPGRIRIPGLRDEAFYRIEPIELSASALTRVAGGPPSWWSAPATVSGAVLRTIGLQGPMLYPEQALLFRLVAIDGTGAPASRTVERK
ncbi:alpha-galactosidase [Microbacterium lushaniae]|uniref:Alpha-galactosidase n=1 Tax=Microbacterium lushaniae TaxID=2614639 RepID=A0A5J6L328_9MICO|nr:alpha-galactosidase [Microbacterium lushaniae]QEW02746.1 alpha-galactosidase [Microbacterium lushaniae]